ncbi:MAG: thiamine-phosphate kinase [Amphiplicatus sp.]
MSKAESEFDLIRLYFAPLAEGAPGAFGLLDDAALIPEAAYIVTKDLMVEGVHFLADDPLDLTARKLIRVNLSDLAAKGARPVGYFLGCVWPSDAEPADIELFAKGLAADQEQFRLHLFGGDTTRHKDGKAPLTLSATFFGAPARSGFLHRKGAALGDDLYVTGTIGDAGLGLAALKKAARFDAPDKDYLVARCRLPEPRLVFGGALPGLASAAIDISDGLLADAGHLAALAGLAAEIDAAAIPLSAAAARWLERTPDKSSAYGRIATAGDDYEILFAADKTRRRAVEMAAKVSKTPVARIGSITRGEGALLKAPDGSRIPVRSSGFDHFSRR